jgi:hypothetical protein
MMMQTPYEPGNQFIRPGGVQQPAQPVQPAANHNWGDWQGHYFDTALGGKGVSGIDATQGQKITQTRDQFLDKYKDAIDANGNFIPGKANLYFDGENAGKVYDNLIGYHGENGKGGYFAPEVNMGWVKDDRKSGWLQQHGVNPDTLMAAAALATGGGALGAFGGAAAGGAAAGGAASGLAGSLGMSAGLGATALNAGALNTGMSLLRGQNIGDSLKAGATGALLSPVGSFVGGAVGGGVLGNIAGQAAQGGAGAALRGGDVWSGVRDGAVNGAVSSAGQFVGRNVGGMASDLGKTGSQFVGQFANTATQQALRGRRVDPGQIVQNQLYNYGKNSLFRG